MKNIIQMPETGDDLVDGTSNKFWTDARADTKADAAHAAQHGAAGSDPVTLSVIQVSGLTTRLDNLSNAIDGKAPLASPAFTGLPTAPNLATTDSSTKLANTKFVQDRIAEVINGAPSNLDTLQEIAAQLSSDETASSALVTTVGTKLAKSANLSDLTDAAAALVNIGAFAATGGDLGNGSISSVWEISGDYFSLTADGADINGLCPNRETPLPVYVDLDMRSQSITACNVIETAAIGSPGGATNIQSPTVSFTGTNWDFGGANLTGITLQQSAVQDLEDDLGVIGEMLTAKADAASVADAIAKAHDAVTIGTGNGLSLAGQAISLAAASGATAGAFAAADYTKLAGIATGATANSSDATLLNRANHTGAQAISTVTSLQATLDAKLPLAGGTMSGVITFPDNMAMSWKNSGGTACRVLVGSSAGGAFYVGDVDGTLGLDFKFTVSAGHQHIWIVGGSVYGRMLSTDFRVEDGSGNVMWKAATASGKHTFAATMTAAGTTGNQTINKPTGSVNIAAGNSSVVVTNSLVSATSIVIPVVRSNDTTAEVKNVVCGTGSFTITLTAATTAETSIGFLVFN